MYPCSTEVTWIFRPDMSATQRFVFKINNVTTHENQKQILPIYEKATTLLLQMMELLLAYEVIVQRDIMTLGKFQRWIFQINEKTTDMLLPICIIIGLLMMCIKGTKVIDRKGGCRTPFINLQSLFKIPVSYLCLCQIHRLVVLLFDLSGNIFYLLLFRFFEVRPLQYHFLNIW